MLAAFFACKMKRLREAFGSITFIFIGKKGNSHTA